MTDVCLQCSVSVRLSPSYHPPICQCVRLHHHDKVFFETEIFLSSSIDMKTQKKRKNSHTILKSGNITVTMRKCWPIRSTETMTWHSLT